MEELQVSEVAINVRSFAGAGVVLKVAKKVGMENVELLAHDTLEKEKSSEDEPVVGDLWSTLSK